MTRPMSEPSPTQRAMESAYAIRQLQRRPAPAVGARGISAVTLWDYDFVSTGDNLIPDETWTPIAVGDHRYWVEGQSTDNNWSVDLDAGTITRQTFGLYALWGSVAFVDNTPGNVYGAAIKIGLSNSFFHTNAFTIENDLVFRRVTVSSTWWGRLENGATLHCYQKSGGTLELGMVSFTVALLAEMGVGDEFYFQHA